MKTTTVVRIYSVAFMLAMLFTIYVALQPVAVPTERPQEQQTLYANVPTVIPGPPPIATGVEQGESLAYLRIPRFGENWLWTISEGTDMETLAKGPGHFEGSALPGARGNTAYAAHRAGHGDPFIDFDTLEAGDEIFVAQNGAEWTYEVLRAPQVIEADNQRVIRELPKLHRMTLITCWPKYSSEKRMFIRARLIK